MDYKMMDMEMAAQNSGGSINWVLIGVIIGAIILGVVCGILLGKHTMKKRDI
jgi:hypothetical protein